MVKKTRIREIVNLENFPFYNEEVTSLEDAAVAALIKRLSVEEKVGQLVWMPFAGLHKPRPEWSFDVLLQWIERYNVGGFVLYGGDVFETPAAINYLQRRSKLPVLIAADMERGCGEQVRGATVLPGAMAVGATGAIANAELAGRITGAEARAIGVHIVFAPVADVNTEPRNPIINTRAFSDRTELVADMVSSFVAGCQAEGTMATVKHFPGHGATAVDSHLTLPTVSLPFDTLEREHIQPFAAAIRAGVGALMIGHLRCPAIDPDFPSSLSHRTITGLLRNRLGFRGLIITDALMMGAISEGYGDGEAAVLAIRGGADVILYPKDIGVAVSAILNAVKAGEISMEVIDAAVMRVLEAKASAGLFKQRHTPVESAEMFMSNEKNITAARNIAEEAVTLVGENKTCSPLTQPVTVAVLGSPDAGPGFRPFVEELIALVPSCASAPPRLLRTAALTAAVSSLKSERRPVRGEGEDARSAAADEVFVGSRRLPVVDVNAVGSEDTVLCTAFLSPGAFRGGISLKDDEVALVRMLLGKSKRVCLISFGSPYVLKDFPDAVVRLCTYSDCEASQGAAARVLAGKLVPRGKLPVKL